MQYIFSIFIFVSFVGFTQFAIAAPASVTPTSSCLCVEARKGEIYKGNATTPSRKYYGKPFIAKTLLNTATCPAPAPKRVMTYKTAAGKKVVSIIQSCKVLKPKV